MDTPVTGVTKRPAFPYVLYEATNRVARLQRRTPMQPLPK